jgi:hypothetical protein
MTDETTELLIRARGFIECGWCTNAQARDAEGTPVPPRSDSAVSWCTYGAPVAAGMPNGTITHPAFVRLDSSIEGAERIAFFNNTQKTVEPVLAAFDRAIEMSGSEG